MFEKETKFITDFVLNKVKNLGSSVTVEKLHSIDIHPAILKYISSELDYLVYEDRKKLLGNSVFDYSGVEIARYFGFIGDEIKKTKKISFEDIKKLIVQAVSFNLNYLARPKWSLIKLIYNESQNKPVEEIKLMLNHLYFYDYLKNIIISYVSKRKLISLSMIEFELILNKIDKELFSAQPNKLIENALLSMGEFFNLGGSGSSKIPVQPVEIYLKEKNQIEYLFRLRRAVPVEAKQKYQLVDIKNIIFSATPPVRPIPVPDEPEIEQEENEVEMIEQETHADISEPFNEPDEVLRLDPDRDKNIDYMMPKTEIKIDLPEEEDLLKIYDEELRSLEELEKQLSSAITEVEEEKEIYEFEEDAAEKEVEEELLASDDFLVTGDDAEISIDSEERHERIADADEDFQEEKKEKSRFGFFKHHDKKKNKPDEVEPVKKKDVFNFLSDKEIDKIVENVFSEDRDDFATTMEKIAECGSYEDATEIIKSVFLTYRINPYSREAVTLTNAVANFYNQT